jgi:hypothetical protein
MSFFSVLGKIGSGVGKAALGVAGRALDVATFGATNGAINSKMLDNKHPIPAAPAVAASLQNYPPDTQNAGGGGLLATITNFFGAATGFLSGKTHVQTDIHTEVGGTRDVYGNTSNGLPSWLLPVGIGAAVLFMFSGNKRR